MCLDMYVELRFFCEIEGRHYHICQDCLKKPKGPNDYLRIAYMTGNNDALDKAKEIIHDLRYPE